MSTDLSPLASLAGSDLVNDLKSRIVAVCDKLVRYKSHRSFLSSCLDCNIVPKGFCLKFGFAALPPRGPHDEIRSLLTDASTHITRLCFVFYNDEIVRLTAELEDLKCSLRSAGAADFIEVVDKKIQLTQVDCNARKNKKFQRLGTHHPRVSEHSINNTFSFRLDESVGSVTSATIVDVSLVVSTVDNVSTSPVQSPPVVSVAHNGSVVSSDLLVHSARENPDFVSITDDVIHNRNGINKKKKNRRFKRRKLNVEVVPEQVINLSSTPLTEDQTYVLSLGAKFCPTPRSIDELELLSDVQEGERRLRLKEFFFKEDTPSQLPSKPKFYKKKPWTPPVGRDKGLDAYCDTLTTLVNGHIPPQVKKCNLSKNSRKALSELRDLVQARKIRICTADKGGATVVQDVSDYEAEALRQLNNTNHYRRLAHDPTALIAQKSNDYVEVLWSKSFIDENTYRWALLEEDQIRTSVFYHLPKVHKDKVKPPGRPIVSGCSGPTEKLSKLVDHWLQPVVTQLPSYVKDTTHFLQIVEEWKNSYSPLPPDALLVTIDVVGLYTNIPHPEVAVSVTESLTGKQHLVPDAPPTSLLLKIIHHVLENNIFTFNEEVYQQIFGTAMGTPMAPPIANIFMGWLEHNIITGCPWTIDPATWRRYIDDIITLWVHGEEELHKFMSWLNLQHPSIKFTYSFGRSVNYLDVNITINNEGLISTDLHIKPTDAAMVLPFHSCHPRHCTRSIPYSQCLRLRRICSEDTTFHRRCQELTDKLTKRGYPSRLLEASVQKVAAFPRASTLQYQRAAAPKNSDRVPFIIRHNPSNPPLGSWLKQFLPVLHTSVRMRKAVPYPPIVGERNCKSLRALLMPSALPPVPVALPAGPGPTVGCRPCSGCVLCNTLMQDTETFQSVVTGRTFNIRDSVTCTSTNVIYLIDCAQCHNTQYVGETGCTVRKRFYGHTYTVRKGLDTLVSKHFRSPGHSLADMRCTVIEQVKATDATVRKQREKFWRHKLHTNYPEGLNVFD